MDYRPTMTHKYSTAKNLHFTMPSQKSEWETHVTFQQWELAAFILHLKTWMSNTIDSFWSAFHYGNSPTNINANSPCKLYFQNFYTVWLWHGRKAHESTSSKCPHVTHLMLFSICSEKPGRMQVSRQYFLIYCGH